VRDTEPPVADAGLDALVEVGTFHTLDGTDSYDNDVISSFTWEVEQPGGTVVLYGARVYFAFNETGNFTATLTVTDAAGNTASDTVHVDVWERDDGGDGDGGGFPWWAVALAVVVLVALAAAVLARRR
jgi:hypothetical protein